jgi:hypothetical protein
MKLNLLSDRVIHSQDFAYFFRYNSVTSDPIKFGISHIYCDEPIFSVELGRDIP